MEEINVSKSQKVVFVFLILVIAILVTLKMTDTIIVQNWLYLSIIYAVVIYSIAVFIRHYGKSAKRALYIITAALTIVVLLFIYFTYQLESQREIGNSEMKK